VRRSTQTGAAIPIARFKRKPLHSSDCAENSKHHPTVWRALVEMLPVSCKRTSTKVFQCAFRAMRYLDIW